MKLKYTVKDMCKIAQDRGFEFLSTKYMGMLKKHTWKCAQGHTWNSIPRPIKDGSGCPYCAGVKKLDINDMHKLARSRGFVFLSREANGVSKKYKWQCSICNYKWQTTANSIQQGSGCAQCSGKARKTVDDFKRLAASKGFKFLSTKAMGVSQKHEWQCKNGHKWHAIPDGIRIGTGCPYCNNNVTEEKCRFIFESLTQKLFPSNWNILGNLQLDGFCKELMMAFEYQGIQHYQFFARWHKSEKGLIKQQERDKRKTNLCQQKGILKIDIPYTEATSDKSLEQYIKHRLQRSGYVVNRVIEWDNFLGKPAVLEELQQLISLKNIRCISNTYVDSNSPLLFECNVCKFRWRTTSSRIKRNKGCYRCNNQLHGTIDEMRKIGKNMNMRLLSSKYISRYSKLRWECLLCDYIWSAFPNNTVRGHGCPKCGEKKRLETYRRNQKLAKQ